MTGELAALAFVAVCFLAVLAFGGYAKDRDRHLNVTGELPHAARRLRLVTDELAAKVAAEGDRLATLTSDSQLRRSPR